MGDMSFRTWLSVLTAAALAVLLYVSRNELVIAWRLLERVDLRILAILIPLQLLSYYAVGAMIFEYLKGKKELDGTHPWEMTRMALELNFVNHVLPSGGVSGISYMGWRLKQLGVSPGRATMAQVVRFAMTYGAYLILLLIALLFITIDGAINRFTILSSTVMAMSIIFGTLFVIYIIGNETRVQVFSLNLSSFINRAWASFGFKRKVLVKPETITNFFSDLHRDYVELKAEKRLLRKPFAWAFIYNASEIAMFFVAFWALGSIINPASLLIAYGLAGVTGFFVVTPGGAGAYEFVMVSFLTSAGVASGAAIAAILLARVLLILTTIITGYIFYQLAILKYGKHPVTSK